MVRRDYQDFTQWADYGTSGFWAEIDQAPCLAGEIVLQRLVMVFGLRNPSEVCSARLAAGIMTAQHGPCSGACLTDADMDRCFNWVKARPCMPSLFRPHLRSRSQPRQQYIR